MTADYDTAIAGAARVLAQARRERDQLAAAEGAEAVAQAAHYPGGPDPAEIQARYTALQQAAVPKAA